MKISVAEKIKGKKTYVFNRAVNLNLIILGILVVGFAARLILLGLVPGGMNQDEAFAGYEAYSLAHYGMDSAGNPFPVYFVSWGSGMNVLNSYLMMPFVALFGLNPLTVRLPQVIVSCCSLYVFWRLFVRLFGEKQGLIAVVVLTINPWHLMMSRWGLESNLAPGFLLFGLYAFVRAWEKPGYYVVSAICYGLSLYCYATIWPIVPLILVLQVAYCLWTRKLKPNWWMLAAGLILAFMALPLLLFLLINQGWMPEIRTGFFTIPKLVCARSSEISLSHLGENFRNLWQILWTQEDGLIWNTTKQFGLYYPCGFMVALVGIVIGVWNTVKSLVKRRFDGAALFLTQLLPAVLLGCLIQVNVNRVNCIHLPIIAFIVIALFSVMNYMGHNSRLGGALAKGVFVAAFFGFVLFEGFYYNVYAREISVAFDEGLEEAVHYVEDTREEDQVVYVSPQFSYSKILMFSEYPVQEWLDTVVYSNYPSPFLRVSSFGHYRFDFLNGWNVIYVVDAETGKDYQEAGMTVTYFDHVAVARWK